MNLEYLKALRSVQQGYRHYVKLVCTPCLFEKQKRLLISNLKAEKQLKKGELLF